MSLLIALFASVLSQHGAVAADNTHRLLTIINLRGVQPIRNEYDMNGRRTKQTDAFGKEQAMAAGRVESRI